MREYRLSIPTNAWNALRYVLFTLLLVPLAEKLWARTHSKRTGQRILQGRKARLRRSRLAHWGLHQEVDENSRLSKAPAIDVCVLHIPDALLFEYGTGSVDTYVLQNAVLSWSLSVDRGLRSDGVYFFDAGYVLGKPYGSVDCIDGEPRSLKDFGLQLKKKRRTRIFPFGDIPARRNADRKAEYFIRNTDRHFLLFDNRSARWYEYNTKSAFNDSSQYFSGFANKSVSCRNVEKGFVECYENEGKDEQGELLSDVLTDHFVSQTTSTKTYRRHRNTTIRVILNRVSVTSDTRPSRRAEAATQTEWVRRGMPRADIPGRTFMYLYLNTTELRDGCGQKHAIPVSNLRKSEGLNISRPTFPYTQPVWKGDHKLIICASGNRLALGTLTHTKNEYCAVRSDLSLCAALVGSGRHELALYQYTRKKGSLEVYSKVFNVSVQSVIRKRDALDLVVQACAELFRRPPCEGTVGFVDSAERVARLIRSGRIVSGLVRLEGKGIQGKSVLPKSNIGTINILGLFGTAILILLVAAPTFPVVFYCRQGFVVDVESSFMRSVMQLDGAQNCQEAPDGAPCIDSKDTDDCSNVISHTYKI